MAVITVFTLSGPVRPESRQIGRGPAIDGLEHQVVALEQHTLLLAERRVGKTSMALATLDRVRDLDTGWALEADLSRGPIVKSGQLADRLAEQARAARVHLASAPGRVARLTRKAVKLGGSPTAREGRQGAGAR